MATSWVGSSTSGCALAIDRCLTTPPGRRASPVRRFLSRRLETRAQTQEPAPADDVAVAAVRKARLLVREVGHAAAHGQLPEVVGRRDRVLDVGGDDGIL